MRGAVKSYSTLDADLSFLSLTSPCLSSPPFSCLSVDPTTGDLSPSSHPLLLQSCRSIASEFIGPSAASQVNISSAVLKRVDDRLAALPNSLSLNIFDEAASEILKMMNADSVSRREGGCEGSKGVL
jgi:hypothetical protein